MPKYTKYSLSEVIDKEVIIEMKKPFCVYRITCATNGKIYIGKSNDIMRRMHDHVYRVIPGISLIKRAISKFTPSVFSVEVLRWVDTEEEVNVQESAHIHRFRSTNMENGYNIEGGGEGNVVGENSCKAKLSKKQAIAIIMDPRPHYEVALEHGVSNGAIENIRKGKNWKHLDSYRKGAPEYINGYVKLSKEKVIAIIMDPRDHSDIALEYNVTNRTIREVRSGKRWSGKDLDQYRQNAPEYGDSTSVSEEQAIAIIMDPRPNAEVGREYGLDIDAATISRIRGGSLKKWDHLNVYREKAPEYQSGRAKLTEEQTIAIIMDPRPHYEVALEHGVSDSIIIKIRKGNNCRDHLNVYREKAPEYQSGRVKLTEEQAIAIIMDPKPHAEVGREYGVGGSAVRSIRSGRVWNRLHRHRAKAPKYKSGRGN